VPRILINGYFLCRGLTGIERFARELTIRLDSLCGRGKLALMVPVGKRCRIIPSFQNIVIIKKKYRPHLVWQFFTLQFFLLIHRSYTVLDFGNTCLPFAPGVVFLHDIYCEMFPNDFRTLREKLGCAYYRLQYRLIAGAAKKIITVSEYSAAQIAGRFHVDRKKIAVIPNGWEHFGAIRADYGVFEKFSQLRRFRESKEKSFYFTLGSLSRRKNLRWIQNYAARHPAEFFVVSGTSLSVLAPGLEGLASLPNVLLTGRLEDGEVKALMETCAAFVFPSYYEGFGIPPLEALSCGAPVVIAASSSLPGIYGGAAHYIDPFDSGADLPALLTEAVEKPDRVLAENSYDRAAERLTAILREFEPEITTSLDTVHF
jgi:glycosyltransferase involved in cell wall biosynthesis